MDDVLMLVKRINITDESGKLVLNDNGKPVVTETSREVFCGAYSIGMREFYAANSTDFHPELKLVLADYLDYEGETLADYEGKRYRILRTYRTGLSLELTLERAPAEDGDADG